MDPEIIGDPEEARRVNAFSVTKGIPLDELMTAVDITEDSMLQGQWSKARFSKGEVYFEIDEHWIRTRPVGPALVLIDFKSPAELVRHKIKWAADDVDLEYRYLDIRLKESITLRKSLPFIGFQYETDAESSLRLNRNGALSLFASDGSQLLDINKPTARDENGQDFQANYEIQGNIIRVVAELSTAAFPVVIDPTYTVVTGTATTSTSSNHRDLIRKSDGVLWCTYTRLGDEYEIYCSYSVDGGENWTEEEVTPGSDPQRDPCIAVDSGDNLHLAWRGKGWGANPLYDNVQYRKRTDAWQAQEALTDVAKTQSNPAIAVDSQDYVHVAWQGQGWGANPTIHNIQYRKRTDAWQAQEALTDIDVHQYTPSIAIDSSDYEHVVWSGYGWDTYPLYKSIQYRKRTDAWQAQENALILGEVEDHQFAPCVAIDASNYVHVAFYGDGWTDFVGKHQLIYCKRTDSWQVPEQLTNINYDQFYPTVALDTSGNVYLVWPGDGWGVETGNQNIQFRKRTDAWQAQVGITDRAYDQNYPSLIWATHPTVAGIQTNIPTAGYAFVWSGQDGDGFKVEYYASDDLAWPGLAPAVGGKSATMAAKLVAAGLI